MSAARQLVSIRKVEDGSKAGNVVIPAVFVAPIRHDIVQFVHTNMNKNNRQAYAVKHMAGMQHSADPWGTGRAVSRVPRVAGGGTSRAGQGAFANMCRKGRMFAPTKTWRKWHRRINTNQKRYAVASALAASAVPALVMGRGHSIAQVQDVPCVVDNSLESITKTKDAIAALKAVAAYDDVLRAANSRKLRAGKGKLRGRRYVSRRGPLVIYAEDKGLTRAFRNLAGVETANVERLNLLQLAPGGHLGRFCIWTQAAFEKLNDIWGSVNRESTQKSGYKLPRAKMTNSDLTRIINSDEVQSKLRAANTSIVRRRQKKNPLKNLGVMVKLNPYALQLRRAELLAQERRAAAKAKAVNGKRAPTRAEKIAKARAAVHTPQQRANFAKINDNATVAVELNKDRIAAIDAARK